MICKSCGNTHQENFCPECGEKAFDNKQLSFMQFMEETFDGFIHFDNKFFVTFRTLITRPGLLSLDYTEGRRVKYMKPIQFFFIANLLFFFFTIGNIYNNPLQNYISAKPYTNYHTKEIVQNKLDKTKLSFVEYEQSFDERIAYNSKEFIFVFIPFYGLVFFGLFFWTKRFFMEHVVFATHFLSFVLLLVLVEFYVISIPFNLLYKNTQYSREFGIAYSIFTSLCISVYLFFSIKKFYKPAMAWTVIASLIVGGSFFTFIQYYRMLLFFKILYLN